MTDNTYDVIILGAGPAGLTAGIYSSRARLRTLILNEGTAGGQLVLTHEIANYPGVDSISGFQLGNIMKKQAVKFGCTVKSNINITAYDFSSKLKRISLKSGDEYFGKTIILAPGGLPRTLGIPGEAEFKGRGVSYCATCDGDFFTGKEIVVVGGGNSALEEAVSLTKYVSKITLVHQFDHFQAFPYAIEEAKSNPKINFIMESTLSGISGDETVRRVGVRNLKTGESSEIATDGVFIFIGYVANTDGFKGLISQNNYGEIIVDPEMHTNIPGVFAAGDCIVKRYRQVTTAVGDGAIAALSAAEYLRTY